MEILNCLFVAICRRSSSQYSLQSPLGLDQLDRASSYGDLSRPTSGLKRPYKNTHLINGFYQVVFPGGLFRYILIQCYALYIDCIL